MERLLQRSSRRLLPPRKRGAGGGSAAVGILLLALAPAAVSAAPPAPGDKPIATMDFAELAEVRIGVASGSPQPLARAPAVATVITAEQIAATGLDNLDDVLEAVAGLHVAPSPARRLQPIYSIRGIHSNQNAQVLVLLDGVPITQQVAGGRAFAFRLPVKAIAAIEVIRGPGSAVNGADAVGGVVNVITKGEAAIAGSELGARFGSFDTLGAWLQSAGERAGWSMAATLEWQKSDGDEGRVVESDLQTLLDRTFSTSASRAPAPLDTRYDVRNLHLTLERGPWTARAWAWSNVDRGMGAGFGDVLDPEGSEEGSQLLLDVSHRRDLGAAWQVTTRATHLRIHQETDTRLFPAGARLPVGADGNVSFVDPVNLVDFPDGVIARPGNDEIDSSLGVVGLWSGTGQHRFRIAGGYVRTEVDTFASKNFGPGVTDGSDTVVDGTLVDVDDTPFIYLPDRDRNQLYLSLQDEWQVRDGWQITAGVRWDDYSDIGSTVNPRLAIVWAPSTRLSTKLLYGSAFRAPSFAERLAVNNPVNLGNPELRPETIDTIELALDYHPTTAVRGALSLFTYRADDLIELVPDPGASSRTTQNVNEQTGYGLELEVVWRIRPEVELTGNYAWQESRDEVTDRRIAGPPAQEVYLALHWRPTPDWSLFSRLVAVSGRSRAAGDSRPEVDDYALLDLTLKRALPRGFSVAAIVRNAFDEDAREPSAPTIPGDYPLEGRSLAIELGLRF